MTLVLFHFLLSVLPLSPDRSLEDHAFHFGGHAEVTVQNTAFGEEEEQMT